MWFQFQQRVKQRLQQPIKHSWEKAALIGIGFGIVTSPAFLWFNWFKLLKIDNKHLPRFSQAYNCRDTVIIGTIFGSVILSGTLYSLREIYKYKLKPAWKTSTSIQNGFRVALQSSMVFTIAFPFLVVSWASFSIAKDQHVEMNKIIRFEQECFEERVKMNANK